MKFTANSLRRLEDVHAVVHVVRGLERRNWGRGWGKLSHSGLVASVVSSLVSFVEGTGGDHAKLSPFGLGEVRRGLEWPWLFLFAIWSWWFGVFIYRQLSRASPLGDQFGVQERRPSGRFATGCRSSGRLTGLLRIGKMQYVLCGVFLLVSLVGAMPDRRNQSPGKRDQEQEERDLWSDWDNYMVPNWETHVPRERRRPLPARGSRRASPCVM